MATGKLLGIDHGIKRIGLAICDSLQLVARELTIIHRTSRQADFQRIHTIAQNEQVIGIIVGFPTNKVAIPDQYTQADTVQLWVERFSQTTPLPIKLWDEQYSSDDAVELAKMKKRTLREPIDDLAARIILQRFLDAVRDGLTPPWP